MTIPERATAVDPEPKPPEAHTEAVEGAGSSSEAAPAERSSGSATSLPRTPGDTGKAGRAGGGGGSPSLTSRVEVDELRRLAEAGHSKTEIAAALGRPLQTIQTVASRHGIAVKDGRAQRVKSPERLAKQSAAATSPFFWRDNDATLRDLIEVEGLTTAAAAERLGTTRNAVIGRANRLGLAGGSPAAQAARARAEEREAAKRAAETRGEFPPPGHCVWPHGDPGIPGFRFCGARAAIPGAPYCHQHMAAAHVPAGKRDVALKQIEWAEGRVAADRTADQPPG